jgi:polyferredoxin
MTLMEPSENRKEKRDLFNYKWIARFYRSKHYPLSFQLFFVLALFVFIYDGFLGPESSDENLITLSLSGLFWYPLIFLSLFLAGRWWCAVCPVGAIAGFANRFNIGLKFPRRLSNWGLPLLAFVVPLWGFREFDINVLREPHITAVWITGVIAVAVVVSILFKGRVFCRYMCPITAPLAVMSRVAPVEVRTKTMATYSSMSNKQQRQEPHREEKLHFDPSKKLPIVENELSTVKNKGNMLVGVGKIDPVCKSCKTHDCYKGNEETEGCPWGEHPATMTRNSACSMCMKCTHSCPPGEPMRLRLRIPFSELWQVFRPDVYEAFTVLVLIGIFNTYLWYETVDLFLPGFKGSLIDSTEAAFPFLSERQVERGIVRYVMSIGIVVALYSIASLASSKLSGQKFKINFANFSYSYLAAFFIYALVGSVFGQIAINGGLYLTAALQLIGVYMYIPQTIIDVSSYDWYALKWIPEAAAAIIVGAYIAYRITRNIAGRNVKKLILAAVPHILMILFFVMIFTTISPRWS